MNRIVGADRMYSGSFSFTVDEDDFRENTALLAAMGVPIAKINGEPYIVSETPYCNTD